MTPHYRYMSSQKKRAQVINISHCVGEYDAVVCGIVSLSVALCHEAGLLTRQNEQQDPRPTVFPPVTWVHCVSSDCGNLIEQKCTRN